MEFYAGYSLTALFVIGFMVGCILVLTLKRFLVRWQIHRIEFEQKEYQAVERLLNESNDKYWKNSVNRSNRKKDNV